MFGFKKRRQQLVADIAKEVISQLGNSRGWQKFLPPVAFRDSVYLVTEDGTIYRMRQDSLTDMETICKIHQH